MIRAYFDDSGKESNPSASYIVLAGYMAVDDFWISFNRQWRHFLFKHGISSIHMKELIPIQGEYKSLGWDITKRDAVLSDFINVIKANALIGVGVAVDAQAWRDIRDNKKYPVNIGDAQYFCFARVLRLAIERVRRSAPDEWLSVTFDSDPEFGASRLRLFRELWQKVEDVRSALPSITFADPKRYVALQAADVLAWESRKELVQKIGGHESTSRYKELTSVFGPYTFDCESELYDREEIEKLATEQPRKKDRL